MNITDLQIRIVVMILNYFIIVQVIKLIPIIIIVTSPKYDTSTGSSSYSISVSSTTSY